MPTTTSTLLEQGIDAGLHVGAQLYASIHREPVMELAIGEAGPGVAMTPQTLNVWLSMTKPTVAAVVAQQVERGELALDEPVAKTIPEFAAHGKESITIEHVLTHTGGFRTARYRFPDDDWATIIAGICDAPLEQGWQPGEQAGYHLHTGWFILGELVQRVTGRELPEVMRTDLFEPLGMDDCWVGMPDSAFEEYVAEERLGVMMDTTGDTPRPTRLAERDWVTHCRPSANGYGPMRQLAQFYEMLMGGGELDGERVLKPRTVDAMVRRRRVGLHDRTFLHTVDWGLGVIVNSAHHHPHQPIPYGFGAHASRSAFGHGGSQSSTSLADPVHGLVATVLWNGMAGEKAHQRRLHALLTALYEDLGLAGPA